MNLKPSEITHSNGDEDSPPTLIKSRGAAVFERLLPLPAVILPPEYRAIMKNQKSDALFGSLQLKQGRIKNADFGLSVQQRDEVLEKNGGCRTVPGRALPPLSILPL